MLNILINTTLAGSGNSALYDEARQLRQAESALRAKLRQAAGEASQGSSLNVVTNYTVGKNGALRLTDATISNGRPQDPIALAEQKSISENAAAALRSTQTAPVQLSDFARAGFTLQSSELASLLGGAPRPASPAVDENAAAQEYVFVRGADGSYYPVAEEADLQNPGPANLSRAARAAVDAEQSTNQALYNVSRLYSASAQAFMFGQGELLAIA